MAQRTLVCLVLEELHNIVDPAESVDFKSGKNVRSGVQGLKKEKVCG